MDIVTKNSKETYEIGRKIGRRISGLRDPRALIIALDGELGTGKTVFVSGLASGLGIAEPVSSPSFTIVKEYQGERYSLYHIDLYRLGGPSDLMSFDFYDYAGRDMSITAVEWASKFGGMDYFPRLPLISVRFEDRGEITETDYERSINIEFVNINDDGTKRSLEEF